MSKRNYNKDFGSRTIGQGIVSVTKAERNDGSRVVRLDSTNTRPALPETGLVNLTRNVGPAARALFVGKAVPANRSSHEEPSGRPAMEPHRDSSMSNAADLTFSIMGRVNSPVPLKSFRPACSMGVLLQSLLARAARART